MGSNIGGTLGLIGAFLFTMLIRWVFPRLWAVSLMHLGTVPDIVKIAAWTLFIGFPVGVILGATADKKAYAVFWAVVFFFPLAGLVLLGKYALPPFWMRGYDDTARWTFALCLLLFGTYGVMWFFKGVKFSGDWLLSFLDRVFGRK
jgi:hypothetical protein